MKCKSSKNENQTHILLAFLVKVPKTRKSFKTLGFLIEEFCILSNHFLFSLSPRGLETAKKYSISGSQTSYNSQIAECIASCLL